MSFPSPAKKPIHLFKTSFRLYDDNSSLGILNYSIQTTDYKEMYSKKLNEQAKIQKKMGMVSILR